MTDGTEHGEKGQEEGPEAASVETGDEIERCPICLNPLLQRDLATPAGCGHVFCLTCILKWAEMVPSCPVDRRPFSVVYVQNSVLGSVKIPVKIKAIQAEFQKIHSNRETEKGRGSMLRSQAPKNLEVTSHAKVKDDFKRKCNGYKCRQDTTELRKKKGRGELCSPRHRWSSSLAAGQLGALTQCLAEFVDVYEEEPMVHRKRCRLEVQERHRLPLATAVADSGLSCLPISPRPYEMIDGGFSFLTPDPITTMQHEAGRFAFQGTVCAVTCTKGEEKKGSRATGSKGAKGKAQTTPTRCSIRNSRAVELSPAQDPGSPQSGHSDSNSSAPDSPPKAGGAPRGNKKQAGKRKAKQAPRQKLGAKRNARSRKKAAPELQSSPEESEGGASEKDGEEESGKEAERQEPEENVADASGRHSDGDSDHEDEGPGSAGSEDEQDAKNGSSPDGTEEVYRNDSTPPSSEEQELEREEMEDLEAREKPVLSSDGECSPTPDCGEEGNASHGETPEKSDSPTSLDEEVVNGELEDQPADGPVDAAEPFAAEESSGTDYKVEAIELSQDTHSGCGPSESWKPSSAPPTSNSPQESCESIAGPFPGAKVSESLGSDETNKEGFEDNTEMVPMDCDLPGSDQDELKDEQEKTQTPPHPASVSQAPDEGQRPERKPLGEASAGAEPKEQAAGRHRKSRFHSATTTWSPKRESEREQQRSRSRSRDNSGNSRESRGERNRSRSCSRDGNSSSSSRYKPRASSRDREGDRDAPKGEDYRRSRNRERTSRRRSRTRSRSRSQSRSRSRTRTYGRGSPSDRAEPGGQSPRRRDRWSNDSRRNPRGNYQSRAHNQDKQSGYAGKEGDDSGNGGFAENSPERGRAENPDWVKEKVKADSEARGKPQWEEDRKNGPGDSWTRSGNQGGWNSDRSRGAGRGQRGDFRRGDASQNRWQSRNSFSGTTNNSGNDSYSRFNENRGNRREGGVDFPEPPMDRSGWSTASSWAVCRTLPADVQNYYSRRGRNSATSGGGWNRPEEEKPAQGPPQSDPNPLSGGEGPPPPLNVVLPRPVGLLPFPVGAHAPPAPFAVPSQVPVYLHSTAPLLQGPPAASQGLPPPPPPPPPMQQVDCQLLQQAVSSGKVGPHLLSSLTKAPGSSFTLPSSTTQPRIAERLATSMELEAHVDSSKKEKKLQIKERAVHEVKMAMKPYYQSKDITKDEYKEIVRKAVEKICHSKSGEVNSGKVANLVKAYVDKYKHDRKNKSDDHSKC